MRKWWFSGPLNLLVRCASPFRLEQVIFAPHIGPPLEFQSRWTAVRARPSSSRIGNRFVTVCLIATEAVDPLEWPPCPSSICSAPMAQDESVFKGLRLAIAASLFSSYYPRFVCGSEASARWRPGTESRGWLPQHKRKCRIQFLLANLHSLPAKRFT